MLLINEARHNSLHTVKLEMLSMHLTKLGRMRLAFHLVTDLLTS